MATASPIWVVKSAWEMPPAMPPDWANSDMSPSESKVSIMPTTVPSRPVSGATATMVKISRMELLRLGFEFGERVVEMAPEMFGLAARDMQALQHRLIEQPLGLAQVLFGRHA